MSNKLTGIFIDEMIALCLREASVFVICREHVKFSFFPNEDYKKLWKYICDYNQTNQTLPTIGILAQTFQYNESIVSVLSQLKTLKTPIIHDFYLSFESFIKQGMFVEEYEPLGMLFNQGERDLLYHKMLELSTKINGFSLNSSYYEPIFEGFNERYQNKLHTVNFVAEDYYNIQTPFGIDELDYYTNGGPKPSTGDTVLFLAQSGVGKSTLARHIGIRNARKGLRVAHFQLEGSKQECLDAYDASWIGVSQQTIELAGLKEEKVVEIQNIINQIEGEIYVESFEEFDTCSMNDIESRFDEMEKLYGKFHVVIIDYMELAHPGDGKKYKVSEERQRREAIANRIKNFSIKKKVTTVTFTQGSTVDPSLLNDPKFVQTRFNISENKGVIKPFSYFITINQTEDESNNRCLRLYCDKFRKTKSGQTIKIATAYHVSRFYDRKRTLNEFATVEF